MKVLLNVTVGEIPDKINRQIEVDENISLSDLCEYIIISMNGNKILLYGFMDDDIIYSPILDEETENEKNIDNLALKDFNLKKDKTFTIIYNFNNNYYFDINVDNIYDSDDKNVFRVLSGKGYGILDNTNMFSLKYDLLSKTEKEFIEKKFDYLECNERITNYIKDKKDRVSPKNYVINVSLYGFTKEIKRKIIVNSNISIGKFCSCVILAMNGDLSHLSSIKIGKNCLEEEYNKKELFYLNLKEKQKFKIIYDFGDNWIFNLTLSKINDGYAPKDFEVISGKGYGIIDDAGGIWGLEEIFSGRDTSWGEYDINEFDLDECNKSIESI